MLWSCQPPARQASDRRRRQIGRQVTSSAVRPVTRRSRKLRRHSVSARVAHRVTVCGHAQMFSPTREVWNGDQSPSPCQRSRTEVRKSRRSRTVTGRKGSAARCDRPWAIQAEHTHQASIAAQQPPRPSCLIGIVDQLTASPDDLRPDRRAGQRFGPKRAPRVKLRGRSNASAAGRGRPGGRPHPRGHHQHLAELLAIGVDRTGARAARRSPRSASGC